MLFESLPSRERGLKSLLINLAEHGRKVAPFAGAWIEIFFPPFLLNKQFVAPFAGAWIEITSKSKKRQQSQVAPFAGAWIEIKLLRQNRNRLKSLPSRERGLKFYKKDISPVSESRSLRGSVD